MPRVTLEAGRRAVEELYGPPPTVAPGEALAAIGIDLDRVNARLTESFGEAATAPKPTPFDDAAKAALVAAVTAAGDGSIGTEHVLLGLLGDGDGRAVELLRHLGVDVAALAEPGAHLVLKRALQPQLDLHARRRGEDAACPRQR